MSIILKQPSEEYTSEYESIGPQFFSQISKEEGDIRSKAAYDTYQSQDMSCAQDGTGRPR